METLNLGMNRVPGEVAAGHQLLDFRENLWLSTTSVLVSVLVLRDEYPGVGIISPTYHGFALPDQKRRVAGGSGASNPQYNRVVGVLNVELHWVAFLIDRKDKVLHVRPPSVYRQLRDHQEECAQSDRECSSSGKNADIRESHMMHPAGQQFLRYLVYHDIGNATHRCLMEWLHLHARVLLAHALLAQGDSFHWKGGAIVEG